MGRRERIGAVLLAVPLLLLVFGLASRLADGDRPAERAAASPYLWVALLACVSYVWSGPSWAVDPRPWRVAITAGYWLASGLFTIFCAVWVQFFPDRWYGVAANVLVISLSSVSVGDGARRFVAVRSRSVPAAVSGTAETTGG